MSGAILMGLVERVGTRTMEFFFGFFLIITLFFLKAGGFFFFLLYFFLGVGWGVGKIKAEESSRPEGPAQPGASRKLKGIWRKSR